MGSRKGLLFLLPFALSQYYYWFFTKWPSRVSEYIPKCLPIACLAFFILTDENSRNRTNGGRIFPIRISLGLFFCLLGDFFLTFDGSEPHFLAGTLAFGIGHACYIFALRGKRNNILPATLIVVAVYLLALKFIIFPCVFNHDALAVPATVYGLMLACLIWSAVTRVPANTANFGERVASIFGVIGAVMFSCSDMIIITTLTCDWIEDSRTTHATAMITYYLGQLFITLSTIETRS